MFGEPQTEEFHQKPIKHVLIVEDDKDLGDILVALFQVATDYQPSLVHDGWQALRYVAQRQPDLMVLDYQLPGMDGVTLYDLLHAMKGREHIPAVFLSANVPQGELQKRHLIGIAKPFDVGQFIETIQAQIG